MSLKSMTRYATIVLVLALAVTFLTFITNLTTRPLDVTKPSVILGDPTYDISPLKAPTVSGYPLVLFSSLLTKSFLGFPVRRLLLQDNGLYKLREVSSQMPNAQPLHFPLHRLGPSERSSHAASLSAAVSLGADAESAAPFFPRLTPEARGRESRVLSLHRRFESGETTPMREAERVLEAARRLQPVYRMFALPVDEEGRDVFDVAERLVREQAAESTKRYKEGKARSVFDGVPCAFKDMIEISGYVMTDGSAYNAKFRSPSTSDDAIVRRFRDLGAIILPPTTMTEGGVTPVGYSVHPKGPFNPYSSEHYSGGSSGGSAVAVALGLAAVSIGYDGGGSIRTPASLSGVYGLATTFGRIPFESHLTSTNIKSGPFATTTMDASLAYAVLARKDERARHYDVMYDGGVEGVPAALLPLGDFDPAAKLDLAGVTVGVYPAWANDCTPEVSRHFNLALDSLVARGATVKHIAIPHLNLGRLAHAIKISTEFALSWDGAYSHPGEAQNLIEANTRVTVGLGHAVTAVEALAADRLRGYIFNIVEGIFKEVDVIVTPTTSITSPKVPESARKYGESNTVLTVELTKMIFLANWLGLPGMSCPIGFDKSNNDMPVGFQIMGKWWGEDMILRVARTLESTHTWVPPKDFLKAE